MVLGAFVWADLARYSTKAPSFDPSGSAGSEWSMVALPVCMAVGDGSQLGLPLKDSSPDSFSLRFPCCEREKTEIQHLLRPGLRSLLLHSHIPCSVGLNKN